MLRQVLQILNADGDIILADRNEIRDFENITKKHSVFQLLQNFRNQKIFASEEKKELIQMGLEKGFQLLM